MSKRKYDFAGWVTKNDIECMDKAIIRHNAFAHQDGQKVPLVWQHQHAEDGNVLGHMILENRDKGVYGYGYFNDTPSGQNTKELVQHGDITSMSIYADRLSRQGNDVTGGTIREVSLVLTGANPGAMIEHVLKHSYDEYGNDSYDEDNTKATIYTGTLIHSADDLPEEDENNDKGEKAMKDQEKSFQEVYDTLNEEQQELVEDLVAAALEEGADYDEEDLEYDEDGNIIQHGGDYMKNNVFNQQYVPSREDVIRHSAEEALEAAFNNKTTLKEEYIAHGVTDIQLLFADPEKLQNQPHVLQDTNTNYKRIMAKVRKIPFTRVKTLVADLTEDDARARGYIKGSEKLEQVFGLIKRETSPQTVYKKQTLDRDDIIDVQEGGWDIIPFINSEMREKLEEEIARAILVGDGRRADSPDKIKEDKIRPVMKDTEKNMYAMTMTIPTVNDFIKEIILKMSEYRGSGTPDLYVSLKLHAELKLMEDAVGRPLYENMQKLTAMLGVNEIIPTTFMPDNEFAIVNLGDYGLGASKGGQVTSFEDFDIDFNKHKYLIETRVSGALTIPKSAIVGKITDLTYTKPILVKNVDKAAPDGK